jgi:hypothetical protein
MIRVCKRCNEEFESKSKNKLYCGSRVDRTGCAYSLYRKSKDKWTDDNRDKKNEGTRRYHKENKDKCDEYAKSYAKNHREQVNQKAHRWHFNNIEKSRSMKINYELKRKYGITTKEKNEMIERQDYKCLICELDFREMSRNNVCTDHCHKTGIIRGILCTKCNNGLGCYDDDIKKLSNAIKYLEVTK